LGVTDRPLLRYNRRVMKRPLKPRVLGDVSVQKGDERGWSAFTPLNSRLNLVEERVIRVPFTKILRTIILASAAIFLIFGSVDAPTLLTKAAGDATGVTSNDPATERTQLESQLAQLEGQINQYQGQIASYRTQGKTLNGQIGQLNAKIASLNLQIQATNLTIQQLNIQITNTQSQITATQADIISKKNAIGTLMQGLYQDDHISLIQVFLQNPRLSDFWDETQAITLLQNNLRLTVQQIADLQSQLQDQKHQFEASKSDAASAAVYQASQAELVASTKDAKSQLLQQTKGQETKYQALLVLTQATAAQIRNRIFQLLGGGQMSFEDAYQYAKLASNATGIDPAFLLAILDRESALGQNVGQCSYKTAMSPSNQPLFLAIVQSLNLNPDQLKVSCPNADGVYGGAMGPAQFVPSTWDLYAAGVAKVTGDNPPSPWNNSDAFVATALYLKDGMVGCKAAYSATLSQERCTAAKYYAGSRWQNYLWTYGEAVVERAQSFTADIKTITS
jgi:membrane-bound lytic murein transglycosylase B/outer membrane murein-binding lipoprotein Lpp